MKFAVTIFAFAILAHALSACPDEKNCSQCTVKDSGSICSICENSFYNAQTKLCDSNVSKTIDHCKSYFAKDNNIVCSRCESGYVASDNACVKCTVDNCAICRDDQKCFGCFNSMMVVPRKDDPTKNVCSDSEKCSDANCDICMTTPTKPLCVSCKSGFSRELVNNKCVTGLANCYDILTEGDQKCNRCYWGYYIAADGTCQPNNDAKNHWTWFWVVLALGIIGASVYIGCMQYTKNRQDSENVYLQA